LRASLTAPSKVPAPPELSLYRVERAFWDRLGITGQELRKLPRRKVADYAEIMAVEGELEEKRQQQANGNGGNGSPAGAGSGRAQATEAAYQAMKAQAQPPPMPPMPPQPPT
jgi:hypothetical protein